MTEPASNTDATSALEAPTPTAVADLLKIILAAQTSLKARNDELALQVATLEARVAALEAPGEFYVMGYLDPFGSPYKIEVVSHTVFEAARAHKKAVALLRGPLDYQAACVAYQHERRAIDANAGHA